MQFLGKTRGSFVGAGGAFIALTLDTPLATNTTDNCVPFFAYIHLISLDQAQLSAGGVMCETVGGKSQLISGGYSVATQAHGLAGSGGLTGTLDSNNRIELILNGNLGGP
jgi:hypothetical protein